MRSQRHSMRRVGCSDGQMRVCNESSRGEREQSEKHSDSRRSAQRLARGGAAKRQIRRSGAIGGGFPPSAVAAPPCLFELPSSGAGCRPFALAGCFARAALLSARLASTTDESQRGTRHAPLPLSFDCTDTPAETQRTQQQRTGGRRRRPARRRGERANRGDGAGRIARPCSRRTTKSRQPTAAEHNTHTN